MCLSYFLTCSHRRRPEEYDLHGRKRPRADGPPDFNQRTGLLRAFPVFVFFKFEFGRKRSVLNVNEKKV